jgi:hypothetical protein
VIALVPGQNFLDALRIAPTNWTRYASVMCCRVAVDENGNCTEVEKALFEISNAYNDKNRLNEIVNRRTADEA